MMLYDGFSTTVVIGGVTLIEEMSVTPPGYSGGGPVSTTTQNNNAVWRTAKPKALLSFKELVLTVQYDPALYIEVGLMMNINQAIQVNFPDGSYLVFYGWIDDFSPNELVEGELPTANLAIIASNLNGTVEQGPVIFPAL